MKFYMIILLYFIFDFTTGHPLSDLEDKDETLQPDLTNLSEYFRSLMALSTKTFGMNLTNDHGYVWNDINKKPINYDVGNNPAAEGEPLDQHDIFVGTDSDQKRLTEKDKNADPSNSIKTDKKNTPPIFKDEDFDTKDFKTPETLKELLNNEQFWKWLSEWVGAYMEMLAGHLTKIVKEEVGKQVQFYFNIFESEIAKKSMEAVNQKPNQESFNKPTATEKIVIDDKEFLVTHTSNIDLRSEITKQVHDQIELLRRRNDKEEKKHKNDDKYKPIRVEAQTVYGNSLGNGKVVNVYVFYPKDLNTVLEAIKPITDGVVNGTFTFGPQESVTINGSAVSTNDKDELGTNVDLGDSGKKPEEEEIPEEIEDVLAKL